MKEKAPPLLAPIKIYPRPPGTYNLEGREGISPLNLKLFSHSPQLEHD